VPLNALPGLRIVLPETVPGEMEVVVTLVAVDGAVLSRAISTLTIAAPSALGDDTRKRALQFLQRGNARLAEGQLAPARALFERAADLGLAEAALALAATYDPAEPVPPRLRGVPPDAKEARRWYERARTLGAPEAGQRLRRLDAN
jgi:TPR repeat protein